MVPIENKNTVMSIYHMFHWVKKSWLGRSLVKNQLTDTQRIEFQDVW